YITRGVYEVSQVAETQCMAYATLRAAGEERKHVLAMERAARPCGAGQRMRVRSDGTERDGVARPRKILRAIQRGRRGVPAVGASSDGKASGGGSHERGRRNVYGRCGRSGERRDWRTEHWRAHVFRSGRT